MYSIIDIEATGGNAKIGKITEVAIYNFDGESIVQKFESLINPERKIPSYVQRLTGISNKMVAEAPVFKEVAQDIFNILNGNCFVAHNVKADYSFIRAELMQAGFDFKSRRLCTLELSKQLIPEAESHGLGKICNYLNIEVPNRHRASGDALATIELFKQLKQLDKTQLIQRSVRKA